MPETTSGEARTAISCPKALLDRWRESLPGEPPALASQWHQQYPAIFDADDLALVVNQSGYHFYEWYTAIRLYQRDGSRSLVEKYDTYENNGLNHLRKKPPSRKVAEYERVVPEVQRQILHEICSECGVQLPDLLVLPAAGPSFSFAEVKGDTDSTVNRKDQRAMRDAIRQTLKVRVEVIEVSLSP